MLDPLELVRQAKNRHYAYKPLSETQGVLGEDYTPVTLRGKDITKDPARAATLAAQGVHGANTPQTHPDSPVSDVVPGYAGGGEVIGKVSKLIQDLLHRFGSEAVPTETSNGDRYLDLMKKYGDQQPMTMDEMDELIHHLASRPEPVTTGQTPFHPINPQEKLRREASQTDPTSGVDPYNTADKVLQERDVDHLLASSLQDSGYADGGEVNSSSLKWLADVARKLGISSYADDRARVATGIAKQFYGLDEHGHPKLGGEAWLSSQHGTPPRILDEMTSIPGSLARLANSVFGGKIPENANISPEQRHAMERDIPVPKWSDDAADRVSALDRAVEKETGVGQAHSFPEHVEDAAGMLATPFPASKVAGEAPTLQRIFEYLSPVRPPTMGRYVTDSAMLGGVGTGLDKLIEKLSKTKPKDTSVDPEFEQAAINSTNSGAQ